MVDILSSVQERVLLYLYEVHRYNVRYYRYARTARATILVDLHAFDKILLYLEKYEESLIFLRLFSVVF